MKKFLSSILAAFLLVAIASIAQAATYNFNIDSGQLNINVADNYSSINITTPSPWNITYSYDELLDPSQFYHYTAAIYAEYEVQIPVKIAGIYEDTYDYGDSYDTDKDLGISEGMSITDLISEYIGVYEGSTILNVEDDEYPVTNVNVDYKYMIYQGSGNSINFYLQYLNLSGGNLSSLMNSLEDMVEDMAGGLVKLDLEGNTAKAYLRNGSIRVNAEEVAPVPVPATAWLLGCGLLGLAGLKRRRD